MLKKSCLSVSEEKQLGNGLSIKQELISSSFKKPGQRRRKMCVSPQSQEGGMIQRLIPHGTTVVYDTRTGNIDTKYLQAKRQMNVQASRVAVLL